MSCNNLEFRLFLVRVKNRYYITNRLLVHSYNVHVCYFLTDSDSELASALAASLSDESPDVSTRDIDIDADDEELRQALLLSLESESQPCLPGMIMLSS